jgi:hypothetical protein
MDLLKGKKEEEEGTRMGDQDLEAFIVAIRQGGVYNLTNQKKKGFSESHFTYLDRVKLLSAAGQRRR